MLNPHLFKALQHKLGPVNIVHENQRRVESGTDVIIPGEHYSACCPFCRDTRFRFSVSYLWLQRQPLSTNRWTGLARCFNEGCREIYSDDFQTEILDLIEQAALGLLGDVAERAEPEVRTEQAQKPRVPLPTTAVPLLSLPDGHEAHTFFRRKYPGLPMQYAAKHYGLMYCEEPDTRWFATRRSIIFPVHDDEGLLAWQARSIDPDNTRRWFFPPGIQLPVFNLHRQDGTDTAVVAEGIPATIACGPTGVGLFGKDRGPALSRVIAEKVTHVIIATDPETFVPNMKAKGSGKGKIDALALRDAFISAGVSVRMVNYPPDILDLARRFMSGEKVTVPDPADIGVVEMQRLIRAAS